LAADLAVKAPVYKAPPVVVAPFNWTGFYVGINGGTDWFNNDWFVPNTPINVAGGCIVAGCNFSVGGHSGSSWRAGGQAGFNYQVNWAVFGIEAEGDWTNLQGSNAQPLVPQITDHSKTDAIGTIAARLGAAPGWARPGIGPYFT
jgi:outer membrane immunogenic protein